MTPAQAKRLPAALAWILTEAAELSASRILDLAQADAESERADMLALFALGDSLGADMNAARAAYFEVIDGIRPTPIKIVGLTDSLRGDFPAPDKLAAETRVRADAQAVCGKVILVREVTAYVGDSDVQDHFCAGADEPPYMVRVAAHLTDGDLIRWMDETSLDPIWDVEPLDSRLRNTRSAYVYGKSYALTPETV